MKNFAVRSADSGTEQRPRPPLGIRRSVSSQQPCGGSNQPFQIAFWRRLRHDWLCRGRKDRNSLGPSLGGRSRPFIIRAELSSHGLDGNFEQLWVRTDDRKVSELCCVPFFPLPDGPGRLRDLGKNGPVGLRSPPPRAEGTSGWPSRESRRLTVFHDQCMGCSPKPGLALSSTRRDTVPSTRYARALRARSPLARSLR